MKNQWNIWIWVLAALVVILLIMNISASKNSVTLTANGPSVQTTADEGTEFLLMDEPIVETPAAPTSKAQKTVAPAAVVSAGPVKAATPVVTSASLPKGLFTIQAASFKEQKYAEAELQRALAAGLPAYLASSDLGAKGVHFRVYVGKFATKAEADQLLPKTRQIYPGSFILILKK